MTTATFIKDDQGSYKIDITGHANYNSGADIVCSAVSTLSFTLMSALNNTAAAIKNIDYKEGEVHIHIKPHKRTQNVIDVIIETIMTGFVMLEQRYPDNVTLNL